MQRRVNGNGNIRRWGRLHRWCGISAVAFVIVLSLSGIVLNHAHSLGLDERYLKAEWLLDFYGIEAPPPAGNYRAGAHQVTQLGERLYLDRRELGASLGPLAGAVQVGEVIAVAAGSTLIVATGAGELIESMAIDGPGTIDRIGRADRTVVVSKGGLWYRSDEELISLSPVSGTGAIDVAWSDPNPIEPARLEALRQLFRGRGISAERLLADLHSGRLFGRHGPLVMDLAGVAFVFLGLTGLVLFLRRRA